MREIYKVIQKKIIEKDDFYGCHEYTDGLREVLEDLQNIAGDNKKLCVFQSSVDVLDEMIEEDLKSYDKLFYPILQEAKSRIQEIDILSNNEQISLEEYEVNNVGKDTKLVKLSTVLDIIKAFDFKLRFEGGDIEDEVEKMISEIESIEITKL